MADISTLGNLNSSEPLDLSIYKPAQEFQLPPAGKYTVKAPDTFPPTAFRASQQGFLVAKVDPTIAEGPFSGREIRFTSVSAKTWTNQSGQPESQLGRYLRATGLTGSIPGTPQAQADAVEATAGKMYKVYVDWKARNSRTGFTVEGMKNFPKTQAGTYQSWVEDPEEKDEKGEPTRLRAQLEVTRFLAA